MRLPRLSRKQRVVRNLLAGLAAALVVWYGFDFQAPSLELALRWKAQAYLLPQTPELLYAGPVSGNGGRDLIARCGKDWCFTRSYRTLLFHRITDMTFTEPSDPVTCIIPPFGGDDVLYAAAEIPGAAEAECRIRFQGNITASYNQVSDSFDWEETYVSRGTAHENGIWRFPLELRYQDTDDARHTAEWAMWNDYHGIPHGGNSRDFRCTAQLTFYDAAGTVLVREELVLYEAEPEGSP